MKLRPLAIQSRDGVYKEAASQVNREYRVALEVEQQRKNGENRLVEQFLVV